MQLIRRYSNCFVCGDQNETGLKVDFYYEGGVAKGEYVPEDRFQGYKDILHGGIISSLLDEVMIKSVIAKDLMVVTAQIEVRFLKMGVGSGEYGSAKNVRLVVYKTSVFIGFSQKASLTFLALPDGNFGIDTDRVFRMGSGNSRRMLPPRMSASSSCGRPITRILRNSTSGCSHGPSDPKIIFRAPARLIAWTI